MNDTTPIHSALANATSPRTGVTTMDKLHFDRGHHVATKERLAAMAASLCAVCSGVMVVKLVVPDPRDRALELRTYVCAECGHSRTYSVDGAER